MDAVVFNACGCCVSPPSTCIVPALASLFSLFRRVPLAISAGTPRLARSCRALSSCSERSGTHARWQMNYHVTTRPWCDDTMIRDVSGRERDGERERRRQHIQVAACSFIPHANLLLTRERSSAWSHERIDSRVVLRGDRHARAQAARTHNFACTTAVRAAALPSGRRWIAGGLILRFASRPTASAREITLPLAVHAALEA